MKIAAFDRPGVFLPEKMCAERGCGREIHVGGSRGNAMRGEQGPSAQLEVRNQRATGREVPLQVQRNQSSPIRGVCRLEDQVGGNRLDCVFKASNEKTG